MNWHSGGGAVLSQARAESRAGRAGPVGHCWCWCWCWCPVGHYWCYIESKQPCSCSCCCPRRKTTQRKVSNRVSPYCLHLFMIMVCLEQYNVFTSWGKHQSPLEPQRHPWILSTNPFSSCQSSSDAQELCRTPCLKTLYNILRQGVLKRYWLPKNGLFRGSPPLVLFLAHCKLWD